MIKNIVFTGGPCSGKTRVISELKQYYESLGYQVLTVGETASELINSGVRWWDRSLETYDIQDAIFKLQLEKENVRKRLAEKYNKDVIIFYDRGLLDGKGYSGDDMFSRISLSHGQDSNSIQTRYDLAIYLETVSKLDSSLFNHDGNTARTSNVEQSLQFDQAVLKSWQDFPNFHMVKAEEDFGIKLENAKTLVDSELLKEKGIITISGNLGSGKSTVGRRLANYLEYGIYQIGDVMRELAEKENMSLNSFVESLKDNKSVDDVINGEIVNLSRTKPNGIFVSKMAWYFIPESFKVYLYVEETEGARRIFFDTERKGEKYASVKEAIPGVNKRFQMSRERFIRSYGVDMTDSSNYDLYVDTTDKTVEEVFQIIISEYFNRQKGKGRVYGK